VTSKSDDNGDGGRRREPEVEEAFNRLVSEGSNRLDRPLVPLLATGFVGGIDVGVGVLAYLVVYHETGQPLLAAAAFPIGFIALLLARSELSPRTSWCPSLPGSPAVARGLSWCACGW
jgi:formate/nitrite transporter FocA (FNT family)